MAPRKFLLSDAIILVAATAVGLAVFTPYHRTMTPLDWKPPFPSAPPFSGWIKGLWQCLIFASPLAMAWTLAVLALRLRRPRVRWRRLMRQPGLVAGLSAAFVLALRLTGFATMCTRLIGQPNMWVWSAQHTGGGGCLPGWPPGNLLFEPDHYLGTMAMIGLSVASSWLLLLASGRWRAEPGWIDRAGRVLGWFWISILPSTSWWDFHLRS